jgi:hypothetical protein
LLTKLDLAVLRAALQFFDEEMSPHGLDLAAAYFDRPLEAPLSPAEVRALRQRLVYGDLKYVVSADDGGRAISDEFFADRETAEALAAAVSGIVAAVLLPQLDAPASTDLS